MVACAAISKRQDMYKYAKNLETTRYVQIRQKSCFLAFLQAQYTLNHTHFCQSRASSLDPAGNWGPGLGEALGFTVSLSSLRKWPLLPVGSRDQRPPSPPANLELRVCVGPVLDSARCASEVPALLPAASQGTCWGTCCGWTSRSWHGLFRPPR